MNAIIALKKIAKEYDGIKVLKDVTFDIKEGEITGHTKYSWTKHIV